MEEWSMGEDDIGSGAIMSKVRPRFGPNEALEACSTLNLTATELREHLVVLNSDFDLVLCGEPYMALMLLFSFDSGKYIARIWNETITVGTILTVEQLIEACRSFFFHGKPCVGLIEDEPAENELPYLTSYAPIQRRVSKGCSRYIDDSDAISCTECQKLKNLEAHKDFTTDISPVSNVSYNVLKEEMDDVANQVGSEDSENESHLETIPYEENSSLPTKYSSDIKSEDGREVNTTEEKFGPESLRGHINSILDPSVTDNGIGKRDDSTNASEDNAAHTTNDTNGIRKCPYCEKLFKSTKHRKIPQLMRRHMEKTHFWGKFECEECHFSGSFAHDIVDHLSKEEHGMDVTCPRCSIRVAPLELVVHYEICITEFYEALRVKSNEYVRKCKAKELGIVKQTKKSDNFVTHTTGGNKKCPYCDKWFKSSPGIKQHMGMKHFWGNFKCTECRFTGNFAQELINHISTREHNEDPLCPKCENRFAPSEFVFHYEMCITSFYKESWKKGQTKYREKNPLHFEKVKMQNAKKRICEQCGKEVCAAFYNKHSKIHLRQQLSVNEEANLSEFYHYCDKCEKRYSTPNALRYHVKATHEGTVLNCPQCNESFNTDRKLREHQVKEHSTKYQCKECSKRFGTSKYLDIHMRHHKPPQFKCSHCEKMLMTKHGLEAHERGHTGESPFPCDICGNAFKSSSVLQYHRKYVHKVMKPGWKPLKKRERKNTEVYE